MSQKQKILSEFKKYAKKGRGKLPWIKFAALMTVSGALYAAFTLITFLPILFKFGMALPYADTYAVPGFEACGGMSLGRYVALMFILRFIGVVLLCLFCCGISSLIKNHITAMAATAWIYVIPIFLLKNAENKAARCVEPSLLLDGSGFMQLFSSPGAVAVSILICVVIPCILFIPFIRKVIKWNFR